MVARGRLPLTGNSKGKGPEGQMCFAGSRASRVAVWPQVGPRVGIVGQVRSWGCGGHGGPAGFILSMVRSLYDGPGA